MRIIPALPLIAAMLLTACGGNSDADGDGKISGDEAAAAAQGMVQPKPGQYRTTAELLDFDMPGMTDQQKNQMRQLMAGSMAEGNTTCLTPEQAERNGAKQMVQEMARGDCTIKTFDVSGNNVVAEMECAGQGAPKGTVRMEGEMAEDHTTMTMEFNQDIGGQGQAHIKMRMNSQRTGECER
jgi:hypothetical protein